jgi:glycosyltransferase involved in cell wall biosynthesis
MKIALCSTFVPFVNGGYRNIVDWLGAVLAENGHQVEKVYLPQVDSPDLLFQQMMALRWINLEAADRIICFRPQAHLIPHPNKILWFIHHIRGFYDLWGGPFSPPANKENSDFRDALNKIDNAAIAEARAVYSNSGTVSERLIRFNGVESEVLYPPVFRPERFFSAEFGKSITCISRLEPHKRQDLLIDALSLTKTPVQLRLIGTGANKAYVSKLRKMISSNGLRDRVALENRWVSEDEKVEMLSKALGAAYIPVDEDSYGYPTLEAAHASKPTITVNDAGGVSEFVRDGENGFVSEPTPEALADAMDRLYLDRALATRMGSNARETISEMGISWDRVLEKLLK